MHIFTLHLLTAIIVGSKPGGFSIATENWRNGIEHSEPFTLVFETETEPNFQFSTHP